MRSIPKLIHLVLLFLFITPIAYSTDYFVDKSAACNASDGNGIS